MNLKEHLLTCLAEECGEVMEILYLEPDNKQKLEHELNDIVSVAHLLKGNDFVVGDLEPTSTVISDRYKIGILRNDIFFHVKEIHYYACKALRFGLNDKKPNSVHTNKDELEFFIEQLIVLIGNNDESLSLWNRDKLKHKEKKVEAHYNLAIANNTLKFVS